MVCGDIWALAKYKTAATAQMKTLATMKFMAAVRFAGYQTLSDESVLGVRNPYHWFRLILPNMSGIANPIINNPTPEQTIKAR